MYIVSVFLANAAVLPIPCSDPFEGYVFVMSTQTNASSGNHPDIVFRDTTNVNLDLGSKMWRTRRLGRCVPFRTNTDVARGHVDDDIAEADTTQECRSEELDS